MIIMSKAYCVKCRTKTEIVDTEEEITSDGRKAIKGRCAVCEDPVLKMESIDFPDLAFKNKCGGDSICASVVSSATKSSPTHEVPRSALHFADKGLRQRYKQPFRLTRTYSGLIKFFQTGSASINKLNVILPG